MNVILETIGISRRTAIWVAIASFAIECVLLWGMWFAGDLLWDLESASVAVQVLGYLGIYGHLIVDVLLGWLIVKVDSYPGILVLYGLSNWIVLALVIGFGCRYVTRARKNRAAASPESGYR